MIGEMEAEKAENHPGNDLPENKINSSGFSDRIWSVVTYESVAVGNLTYDEALDWVRKLDEQKVSGLCIVTDEAAARIRDRN